MSPAPQPLHRTFFATMREWIEALIIAFIVAMFVRTFVVELFRIPSGSMSPTLIGDIAANVDIDNNGELDQIVYHPEAARRPGQIAYQVFYQDQGKYVGVDNFAINGMRPALGGERRRTHLTQAQMQLIQANLAERFDRILVNKFIYWFEPKPSRGDIMVFKVPPPEFKLERPFYIKRVAGLEGETITITDDGDIVADGKRVTEPEIHDRVFYNGDPATAGDYFRRNGGQIEVPPGHFLAFGDNSFSSADSRSWGPVPEPNLKGKAFLRYWPRNVFGYLR